MQAAIVFESLFGCTRAIAEAVAEGMRGADPTGHVAVFSAEDATADRLGKLDLLVVGSPTHYFGMPSARSRAAATDLAEGRRSKDRHGSTAAADVGPGVREWLERIPAELPGRRAAVFATHLGRPLAGSAARPIARRLRHEGYDVTLPAEGFSVTGIEGPLEPGEEERARAWGSRLVELALAG